MSKTFQALIFSMATAFSGVATAGGTQTWGHVSDALAVGLPLVAAGKAFGTGDSEGVKELTYSLGTTLIAAQTLKSLIHERRPDGSGNDSFPSGHTLHAVTFSMIACAYFPALAVILVPFALLVAISRMVLGLHYPSDVLAGAALGLAIAICSFLAF